MITNPADREVSTLDGDYSFPGEKLLTLAREYCAFLESASDLETNALLIKVASSLSQLFGISMQVPYIEPATDDFEPDISTEKSLLLWKVLHQKLGPTESYWAIYEPLESNEQVQGSLANDLSEIYQDLKGEIALGESNAHQADIQWSWRESFREHWGNRDPADGADSCVDAADALKAIYWRVCR